MIKIGLTGGIGSGKSSIATVFEVFGYPVFYSDIEAKKLMSTTLKCQIIELIGDHAFQENGELNKVVVAKAIFFNKNLLNKLNSIVHPAVEQEFEKWSDKLNNCDIVIEEAALLIESGAFKNMDKIIVATAPFDIRIKRTSKRDQIPQSQVEAKINNQISEQDMLSHADYVVDTYNNFITPQVVEILKKLLPLHY